MPIGELQTKPAEALLKGLGLHECKGTITGWKAGKKVAAITEPEFPVKEQCIDAIKRCITSIDRPPKAPLAGRAILFGGVVLFVLCAPRPFRQVDSIETPSCAVRKELIAPARPCG
jgi:hypothetical protein